MVIIYLFQPFCNMRVSDRKWKWLINYVMAHTAIRVTTHSKDLAYAYQAKGSRVGRPLDMIAVRFAIIRACCDPCSYSTGSYDPCRGAWQSLKSQTTCMSF